MNDILNQVLAFAYDKNVTIDIRFEDGRLTFIMTKMGIDGLMYKESNQLSALDLYSKEALNINLMDIFGSMLERLERHMYAEINGPKFFNPVTDDGYLGKVGGAND